MASKLLAMSLVGILLFSFTPMASAQTGQIVYDKFCELVKQEDRLHSPFSIVMTYPKGLGDDIQWRAVDNPSAQLSVTTPPTTEAEIAQGIPVFMRVSSNQTAHWVIKFLVDFGETAPDENPREIIVDTYSNNRLYNSVFIPNTERFYCRIFEVFSYPEPIELTDEEILVKAGDVYFNEIAKFEAKAEELDTNYKNTTNMMYGFFGVMIIIQLYFTMSRRSETRALREEKQHYTEERVALEGQRDSESRDHSFYELQVVHLIQEGKSMQIELKKTGDKLIAETMDLVAGVFGVKKKLEKKDVPEKVEDLPKEASTDQKFTAFMSSTAKKLHLTKEKEISSNRFAEIDEQIRKKYSNTGSNRRKNYEELCKIFNEKHAEALKMKDPKSDPAIYIDVLHRYMKEFNLV